jgi:hypothetical protein
VSLFELARCALRREAGVMFGDESGDTERAERAGVFGALDDERLFLALVTEVLRRRTEGSREVLLMGLSAPGLCTDLGVLCLMLTVVC